MNDWVPESERDTRWYLWNELFMVRVRVLDTMSTDYIKIHGMPAIGDPSFDQTMARERVIRMMTINTMTEFFERDAPIMVVNYKDTERIYELITNHLNAWKRELAESFHINNAPMEDLQMLDRFANVVYNKAKWNFSTDVVDSILARRLQGTMRVTRQSILTAPNTAVTVIRPNDAPEAPEEPTHAPRRSMADVFTRTPLWSPAG